MDALNSVLAIDFQKILIFVLIYLLVLWVLICVWVFNDAQKRFKSKNLGIVFFLLVFILNFPALLFYLIVRPEAEEEHVFYMHSDEEASNLGGVNVPIVNFIGEDGFKISLQLKVANPKAEKESNLDINLDWKSNDENMKVTEKPKPAEVKVEETVVVKEVKESKPGFSAKVKNVPTSFKNKFKGARTKVSLSMKNIGKKKAIEVKTEDSSNKATIDEVKAEEKPSETLQTKVEEVLTEIKPADASKVDNAKNEVKSEESKK